MNEKTKESKFLDAINKYAEQQKAQITQEIEDYKNNKIEQATEQGLQDAYELIRDDIRKRKAAIVNEVSRQELALKKELYIKRGEISGSVFKEAEKRLSDFTRSADYSAFLERSLNMIVTHIGNIVCKVYLAPFDENKRDIVLSMLPKAQIMTDNHIQIGGIRVFCPEMGITLDDTLDTRLNDQREWFYENSGLKVV